MVIRNNASSMFSKNSLNINTERLHKSLEKLSTGFSVNRASDNAAGLAVSERMRKKIAGLSSAADNVQDGISLLQTAEGALGSTHSLLKIMSKMSVIAANATYSDVVDRAAMQLQFEKMMEEINDIADETYYNDVFLLDGSLELGDDESGGLAFHLSAEKDGEYVVSINKMDTDALGITSASVESQDKANEAIDLLGDAIDKVSEERARCGAMQKRIEHRCNNLLSQAENLSAAESRLRDTDMAEEFMKFTKFSILSESSEAMLAQSNAQPAGVLKLLSSSEGVRHVVKKKEDAPQKKETEEK